MKKTHIVAVSTCLAFVIGCGPQNPECFDASYIYLNTSADPDLVDPTGGEVFLCWQMCRPGCPLPQLCSQLAFGCEEYPVALPTTLSINWELAKECGVELSDIPPSYFVVTVDNDQDGSISSGDAYGTAETMGAPWDSDVTLDVYIDTVLP